MFSLNRPGGMFLNPLEQYGKITKVFKEREILQELLSWESINSKMSVVVADESQEDPKKGLANKYDLCLQ